LICKEPGRAVRLQFSGSSRIQLQPESSLSLKSSRKYLGSGVGVGETVGVAGVAVTEGMSVGVVVGNWVICIAGSVGRAGIKLHADRKMITNKKGTVRIARILLAVVLPGFIVPSQGQESLNISFLINDKIGLPEGRVIEKITSIRAAR
jgi:hypothetical protein